MSKRNEFLLSSLAFGLALTGIFFTMSVMLGGDLVTALVVPLALLVLLVVFIVAIGRLWPNYFLYRGAIEFWSDLQAFRWGRSSKT